MSMPKERMAYAVSFLAGEVHALFLLSQALAQTHSDPEKLHFLLQQIEQLGLADLEALPLRNGTLEGFQFAIKGIRRAAEAGETVPLSTLGRS